MKIWSPIVIVPLRAGPPFAATLMLTPPLPLLDAPAVTLSQDESLLVAVHVHQLFAVTPIVVVPPDDGNACAPDVIA